MAGIHWKAQAETSECGLACLAIASSLLGAELDLATLRRRFPVSARGLTFKEIVEIASVLDMLTRPVRCEISDLAKLKTPSVLHWRFNHFVVLERVGRRYVHVIDPSVGSRKLTFDEFSRNFTGVALEISAAPGFRRRKEKSPLKLTSLFSLRGAVGSALLQTVLLSVVLQAFVLGTPLYLQLTIDEAVLKGDLHLLAALAVGFGAFTLFNAVAELMRGIAIQRVGALLGWDMTGRLFHHMLQLPMQWFHRRRLADALTRFDSIEPVRNLISSGLVGAILDGTLSVLLLVLMFAFAPMLAWISALAVALVVMVKVGTLPRSLRLGMASVQAGIAEKGKRIETLRAMQTIKLLGGEAQRESDWANRYADTITAAQDNANFQLIARATQNLIEGVTHVVVVYIAARAIIANNLTVGMLYAFLSFRQQFTARVGTLVDQVVAWKLLDLHSDRIADIALQPIEPGIDRLGGEIPQSGEVELRGVRFRHAHFEPYVLKHVDCRIAQGEFVAIGGPSGAGKSTLLRVLTGLYQPEGGNVLFDGVPVAAWGPRAVRRVLGVVMQDDELLTGSIADNVSFFDEEVDVAHVWECLRMAAVDDDVRAMPMQLETLVGDMGSSLSGGQKQRVLLARALYRRPLILMLDEATSNIDVAREQRIHATLRSLAITRVVVTHRPETMAIADRVLWMQNGSLVEAASSTFGVAQDDGLITHGSSPRRVADAKAST